MYSYTDVDVDPVFASAMLDIISIAADLLADMPEFMHLSYYSNLATLYKRGGEMARYARLMQVEETPVLLLGYAPEAPANALPQVEAQLHVYAGGISWSGTETDDKGETIHWESYILPPAILTRVAGRETD